MPLSGIDTIGSRAEAGHPIVAKRDTVSRNLVVAGGVRTAIGSLGGALAGHSPTQLGAPAVAEAFKRAKVDGTER